MPRTSIDREILDDLTMRFVAGVGEFISMNPEEYFFIVEEAHWFAIDFYKYKGASLQHFAEQLLEHSGICVDVEHDYALFKSYKQSIKVYGTMMFNRELTHCLLVQQQGSSTAITFPKGKKSKDETGIECAVRETWEEVGVDVSGKIVDMSVTVFDKITLYFVFNMDINTVFKTHTRNEISKIFWFDLRRLADVKNKKNYKLFLVAYAQACRVVENYRKNAFKFDMGRINGAIAGALHTEDSSVVCRG
ncbi:mRNA-decapping enzyme subunit 2 [Pancytospora philotis]|nr:mRNA-decapping enzyme subunit 2 [Pancytospora philotis]KAI4291105.1 mRNA-decapping enzyme subunit 2 [Pancytospora philotis]